MPPSLPPPRCRLVLVCQSGPDTADRLAAALAAGDVATVIIAPSEASRIASTAEVRRLVELCQSQGVAALVEDDAALARDSGADGVHLTGRTDVLEDFASIRSALGPGAIIGADAGGSRHVAMTLGEAGADYVAFGASDAPDPGAGIDTGGDDELDEGALDLGLSARRHDLVAWWAEVFQPPVVAAGVADLAEAAAMAEAGADFVAMTLPGHLQPGEVGAWMKEVGAALAGAAV